MMNKKIAFSGFVAAILFGASAHSAQIASKEYVDAKDGTLLQTVSASYSTKDQVQSVVDTKGTEVLETVDTKLGAYYNKTEVDDKVSGIVSGDMTEALKDYAKTADVATGLGIKADKTAILDMETKTNAAATYAIKATETVASDAASDAADAVSAAAAATAAAAANTAAIADKADKATIGIMGALTTAAKENLVGAINELKADSANAASSAATAITTAQAAEDVADAAAAAAAANATAIADKADKTAILDMETKTNAAATYAIKATETVASDAASDAAIAVNSAAAAAAAAAANATAIADKADKTAILDMETKTNAAATYAIKATETVASQAASDAADAVSAADAAAAAAAANATAIATKANSADVYTKTQVDTELDKKMDAASLSDYATTEELTTGLADKASIASLNAKEDLSNKSNSIAADTGSTVKYTTVNAVQTYALPKPSDECMAASAQCVLAVNKATGVVYWENVASGNN